MKTTPLLPAKFSLSEILYFFLYCIGSLFGLLALRGLLLRAIPALNAFQDLGAITLFFAYLFWIFGALVFFRRHDQYWGRYTVSTQFPGWLWTIVYPVLLWGSLIGILALLATLAGGSIPGITGDGTSIARLPQQGLGTFFLLLSAGLLAPIAEELIFRGILLPYFLRFTTAPLAISLSGLLFALAHMQSGTILTLWILGSAAGFLCYKSGNIWPAIIFHTVNNALAIFVDYTS